MVWFAMRAVVAVLLFVTAAHAGLWGLLQDKQTAPDFRGILPSVSYAPFDGTGHPDVDNIPTAEKIRADLKKLATMTRAIRLYSSTDRSSPLYAVANGFFYYISGHCVNLIKSFKIFFYKTPASLATDINPFQFCYFL